MKRKIILGGLFVLIVSSVVLLIIYHNINKTVALVINSELVQELYKRVNPSNDGLILNKMYNNQGFYNQYILAVGFHNIIDNEEFIVEYVTEKDLENSIHKVFGKDIAIKHEDTYILKDTYCMYKYNKNNKNYEFVTGCDGDTNNYYYRDIVEATENNKELVITEKSIYVYYDWSESMNYVYVYNNRQDKKLIDAFSGKLDKLKFESYKDKASTYKYRFKKVGKEYIFTSFELVNEK